MTSTRDIPLLLLLLLGALTAIAPMSTDMYLPAFPAIQDRLGLAPGEVELSFSAYFVGMLLGMLCYGPISDRFGRRPLLLFGLSLYTLASLLLAGSDSLSGLIGWRFMQGLGGCAGAVLAVAIVRDRCTPQQTGRVMSLITLVMGVAPVFAPLFGGLVLELWGWHAIFVALAGFGLFCLAGLLTVLDESLVQRSARLALRPVLAGYGVLLLERRFIGYSLSQACTTGAMFAYIVGSPFVLIELHGVSPQRFGLFFGVNAIGLVLASQLVRLLLRRFSPQQLLPKMLWVPLLAGSLLMLNQILGLAGLWLILPAFFVLVSSVGLVGPNATALAMAEQGAHAGQASALHVSLTFGMGMLAGLLVSRLHDGSLLPLALVVFCFNIAGLLAMRLRLRREPLAEPVPEAGA
ncbi:multidrug effflux MFS transporter [Pseudomonas sp. MAP12]|uniref:Bcr/CflA family efflux transporter n=1 Tax=Geopseudomonas aromaticivorans TaxID=2849492 RepID=A0ABS6MTW2_9GAMM|nr:multidrug effflux MFS transporter [Pseudomonas aromaticivorans]MBV2132190.1 multidrug effflux MFS transporter [Pseudomonas aromaticivorans]